MSDFRSLIAGLAAKLAAHAFAIYSLRICIAFPSLPFGNPASN